MSKSKRLRSPRYRPTDFRLGALQALYDHGQSRRLLGEVLDFSGQGVRLAVEKGSGLYLSGDTLPYLRVFRGAETFYEGSALVRHVREDDGRITLGVAFKNAWMDLGKLYHLDLRLDLEQRFGSFFSGLRALDRISPRFKAWVADTKYFLDELHERLDAEERRIRDLDLLTRDAVSRETVDLVSDSVTRHLHDAIAALNEIVRDLDEPAHQLHRSYFQHHLNPRFLESPFMARSFFKPLGYAGDYEVMNMLYRDHREGVSLFGRVLNAFACNLTAARANINRIGYLCGRLCEALERRPESSVASVGCGPAQEIRQLIARRKDLSRSTITLLDIEPRAIQYCEKVILSELRESGSVAQVNFIQESIRELIRQERLDEVLEPQDVVIAAGLFDYFSDRMFQHLLKRLFGLLRPGGELLIGNVNTTNDSRFFMEYMAEWFLHHRTPTDLRSLARVIAGDDAEIDVQWEPSGVNLFLHVVRKASQPAFGRLALAAE